MGQGEWGLWGVRPGSIAQYDNQCLRAGCLQLDTASGPLGNGACCVAQSFARGYQASSWVYNARSTLCLRFLMQMHGHMLGAPHLE